MMQPFFAQAGDYVIVQDSARYHVYDLKQCQKSHSGEGSIIGLSRDQTQLLIRVPGIFRRYHVRQIEDGVRIRDVDEERFSIDQRRDLRQMDWGKIVFADAFGKIEKLSLELPRPQGRGSSHFEKRYPILRIPGYPMALICEYHEAGPAAVGTMNMFDLRDGSGGQSVGYSCPFAYYFPEVGMVVQQSPGHFDFNLGKNQAVGQLQFQWEMSDPRFKRTEIPECILPYKEITGFAINPTDKHDVLIASHRKLHRIKVPYQTKSGYHWILPWETVWQLELKAPVSAIAIHPDGDRIILWTDPNALFVMHLETQDIICHIS